jgi:DNA-binding CsgD family transcriptional regulator
MSVISRRRRIHSRSAGWSHAKIHNLRWLSSIAPLALDQLCVGVIVTDKSGLVIEMNRAAEAIVGLQDGLVIRDGQFCARRVFETAKMAKLIAGAAAEGEARATAGRMLIGRCDDLPAYVLTVTPLRTGLAVNGRPFAMIVVVDPARHSPSEGALAEFFGLSPAEARIAVALLTGKRLSDIAAASGVQVTTVRTQLRSILRKVGAKRQSDLVRILSHTGISSISLSGWWLDTALAVVQIPVSFAA